jgi:two-component system cell cycle response regulator DivK
VEPLVLIVDDNEQNAKLARDVLEAAGMSTLSATTAADGLALAREVLPDIILMDMYLPDLDGAQAARRLKEDARTAGIPVVAVTALTAVPGVFDGHLEKPFDIEEFPELVRSYRRS